MINNIKVYAIIPARKGSKGIPNKNKIVFHGHDLVTHKIILAKNNSKIDHIIVTTDDREIYNKSLQHDVLDLGLRPKKLASDSSRTIDTIHYLNDKVNLSDSLILLLQPTTPLAGKEQLDEFFDFCGENVNSKSSFFSARKVTEVIVEKLFKINSTGNPLIETNGFKLDVPRQKCPNYYEANGAFYLSHYRMLKETNSFISKNSLVFEMDSHNSLNLDTMGDLQKFYSILKDDRV